MSSGKILHYQKGFVYFCAYGGYFEKLVNTANEKGYKIWGISKNNQVFHAYTHVKHYKKLSKIAKKHGVHFKIEKKMGLPFIIHRYRKRIGLLIGAIFFALFIFSMQYFVWEINIVGNQKIETAHIEEIAKDIGLHKGAFLVTLDFKDIQKELEYQLSDISWITVNHKGSKVTIELAETTKSPNMDKDQEKPSNLIAKKDGIIQSMEVYKGEKIVRIKDSVSKGDLLVSGVLEDKFQKTTLVAAKGKVIAQTFEQKTFTQPLSFEDREYTGVVKKRSHLDLFGLKLPLFIAYHLDGNYEKIQTYKQFSMFGMDFPLGIYTMEMKEYKSIFKIYTEQEAESVLLKQIAEFEKKELKEAKILNKEIEKSVSNGAYVIKVTYVCEEDIAQIEEIIISK